MVTSGISNEDLAKLAEMDTRKEVSLLCKSGQRLFVSRHLLPGWFCNGTYRWQAGMVDKESICSTYNNPLRGYCKQCKAERKITAGEFQEFLNLIVNGK